MQKIYSKKWKIFIVGHKRIYEELYRNDPGFNYDNYWVLNVGEHDRIEGAEKFTCIRQKDLTDFYSLGKWWAESEGVYNIWRDGGWRDLDFIGFIHYDKELRLTSRHLIKAHNTNITDRINKYLSGKTRAHISFETYKTKTIYNQRILADVSQPEILTGVEGVNCLDYILEDYNKYFGKDYSRKDLLRRRHINLCSCFMIDVATFHKMMGFFDWVVKSHKLEQFDKKHRNRMQGGLAERYFGVFLIFEYTTFADISLIHHYNNGWK